MKKFLTISFADLSMLLIRLVLGILMMIHGYPGIPSAADAQEFSGYIESLGIPFPLAGAYFSKGAEFFGGMFILLGFLKRPAAIALAINFFVAVFLAHHGKIMGEAELAFLYLILSLVVALQGTQRFELDRLLFKK